MITAKYYTQGKYRDSFIGTQDPNHDMLQVSPQEAMFLPFPVGQDLTAPLIFNGEPIKNYINFFGNGIDLYDETLEFAKEGDYFGLVLKEDATISAKLTMPDGISPIDLTNGITIIFDKYSCGKVVVDIEGTIFTAENADGLPLVTYIETNIEEASNVNITFSDIRWDAPATIKGIIFGKIFDIDNFFSYNSISEIRPIGDDQPINEIDAETQIKDDFVINERQSFYVYDNDELFEKTIVKSVEETQEKRYNIKAQNFVYDADLTRSDLNYKFAPTEYPFVYDWAPSWYGYKYSAKSAIDNILKNGNNGIAMSISYPHWFNLTELKGICEPKTQRELLREIAWATCCGIDTTNDSEIVFVPFFVDEEEPIIISNSDNRIINSKVKKGDIISQILIKNENYSDAHYTTITSQRATVTIPSAARVVFESDEPFEFDVLNTIVNDTEEYYPLEKYINPLFTPYTFECTIEDAGTYVLYGTVLDKISTTTTIDVGKKGKILTIDYQTVFPVDMTDKIAQLKKWYSNNNDLTATIVDNESQIKVGKKISIQLANGEYFTGLVTSVNRSNSGTCHTVEVEAHQWD